MPTEAIQETLSYKSEQERLEALSKFEGDPPSTLTSEAEVDEWVKEQEAEQNRVLEAEIVPEPASSEEPPPEPQAQEEPPEPQVPEEVPEEPQVPPEPPVEEKKESKYSELSNSLFWAPIGAIFLLLIGIIYLSFILMQRKSHYYDDLEE